MNKTKLKQLGLALCTLCLSFWGGVSWSEISLFFFGEPEYPTEDQIIPVRINNYVYPN